MRRRPACSLLVCAGLVAGSLTALGPVAAGAATPTASASTVPSAVRAAHATALSPTAVRVAWRPTRTAGYAGTTIRRTVGLRPAATATSGVDVASTGLRATHLVQHGLRPATTYTYALFARDALGHYAKAATTTVRTPRIPARPHRIVPGTAHPALVQPATAGTIAGTVTANGGAVADVYVNVYRANGAYITSTFTGSDGAYSVSVGATTTTGDIVCFDASIADGGPSTGYADQCYQNVPWSGYDLPTGVTPVAVSAGVTTGNIDAALTPAGAISGKVTAATGGAGLGDVQVYVLGNADTFVAQATTDTDGTYRITAVLPSSTGYTVCFDATGATGGPSAGGYRSQCYRNQVWNGDTSELPAGSTPVTVPVGATRTKINAALTSAGAIGGTVTSDTGEPLGNVDVQVYAANQTYLSDTTTDDNGAYVVTGLPASSTGYLVCFDARFSTGGSSDGGYYSECYDNVRWDGTSLPSGLTKRPVSNGAVTTADATLEASASIAGRVTSAATGAGIGDVAVEVEDADGNDLGFIYTAPDGTYGVAGLSTSTAGYTVCFNAAYASGGGSRTGYLDQCYDDVAWNGLDFPSGTTPVPTQAGSASSGIDATLSVAGAVSGKVVGASGSQPLAGVEVTLFDADGNFVADTGTGGDGTYRVPGLASLTPGYTVCFDASFATGGSAAYGYLSQCWQNKYWDTGYDDLPSGTTPVSVATGATHGSISARLVSAGGVSGTVTGAANGSPVGSVSVEAIDASGNYLTSIDTASDGTYQLVGLPASTTGYSICFDAEFPDSGPATGYASQCYNGVPWSSFATVPSGTTPVKVKAGADTAGINAVLATGGAIGGSVLPPPAVASASAAVTPDGPAPVLVLAYLNGQLAGVVGTSVGSSYEMDSLVASTAGYTVCFAVNHQGSTANYTSQCYDDVDWNGDDTTLPSGTTAVPVNSGSVSEGIDADLEVGGTITGKVTADGAGYQPVVVSVFDGTGTLVEYAFTSASGVYRAAGLISGAGYRVCFDPQQSGTNTLLPQCFRNKAWAGGDNPPSSTATLVPVTAGQTTTMINAALKHPAA